VGVVSTLAAALSFGASGGAAGVSGAVGCPTAARSSAAGGGATRLARSEPKSTGASTLAFGGGRIDGAVVTALAVGAGVAARSATAVFAAAVVSAGNCGAGSTRGAVGEGATLASVFGVAEGASEGAFVVAPLVGVVVVVAAMGGDEVVAPEGLAANARGDNAGVALGALGGGTRIDGDVPCAGGGIDDAAGGGTDDPAVFTPSVSTPTLASVGTFGAAGTAPNAGDFIASSGGSLTAGMPIDEGRRARTAGALAMNTSKFSIALNGVQC
jgi:hypothetical protein